MRRIQPRSSAESISAVSVGGVTPKAQHSSRWSAAQAPQQLPLPDRHPVAAGDAVAVGLGQAGHAPHVAQDGVARGLGFGWNDGGHIHSITKY
jgi:hypothetical protein